MSYNQVFQRLFHGHIFAKSEPMDSLEYLPTDSSTPLTSRSNPPEVDSLFKRTEQVVSLSDRKYSARQRPTCPPSRSGDFPPKSENLTEKAKQPKSKKAWRKNRLKGQAESRKLIRRTTSSVSV